MSLFTRLLDDAAVFPPGNLPLAAAVPAYDRHRHASYNDLVGSFVLAAKNLGALAPLVAEHAPGSFDLSMTVPLPQIESALETADAIPAVRLSSLEVAIPDDAAADDVVPALETALAGRDLPAFVEIPRDHRRPALITALSGTAYLAKLRTGGVRADLYPDEKELAEAVVALARASVPFKATAGLHHALRNTDPETGFEQHGFLNLLVGADAAVAGAAVEDVVYLLAERDPQRVLDVVLHLDAGGRHMFRCLGTCSITEPTEELAGLGLIDPTTTEDLP